MWFYRVRHNLLRCSPQLRRCVWHIYIYPYILISWYPDILTFEFMDLCLWVCLFVVLFVALLLLQVWPNYNQTCHSRSVWPQLMFRVVFIFAVGLGGVRGEIQILHVNVYRVAPPSGGWGYYKTPPFTVQCSVPVPTFSSTVRCFELQAVGVFLPHARNPGYLVFS